ncbi:MAG: porin [Alphaproteobacteria bacterium]
MKQFLYGSSALVAALAVAGTVQAAEPLKVGVAGVMQEWFGVIHQKKMAGATPLDINTFGINADTEVDFAAETKLDNGLVVHAQINVKTHGNNTAISVDKQYASVAGGVGTLYLGARESTNDSLHNEAPDVGIGYDDVDIWIQAPANYAANSGVFAGNVVNGTSMKVLINNPAMSVGYVTPQFGGFSMAATFAPSTGTVGAVNKANVPAGGNPTNLYNVWDASVVYAGEFNGVTVGADLGTGGGKGNNGLGSPINSARVFNGGLKVGAKGFAVGGAYLRYDDRGALHSSASSFQGHSWNAGASYSTDVWAISGLYFEETARADRTRPGQEKFDTYMLSGKYTMGPGVDLKATAYRAEFKGQDSAAANNTNGYGLISGLELTF